ncbi:hypothetical protein GCU56_04110 [Geodermatophilus sabuli]|uniref:DUF3224 domain-containing protein n=1 Tax=Geodermatophilus sabuli TaxID=1564158 RepID=A0A7K3VWN4_9ACTN|nr:hypothetical protein [Geodermatophilus sabuli]NEK57056.1 hypothetical protein [Geodermatophilus sabuli]
MRTSLLALVLCAALVGIGASPAAAATRVPASGDFTVAVTGPPVVRPLPGDRCLGTAPVQLSFAAGGTLTGQAPGTIRIAVDAPCTVAFTAPPGTYGDVFAFTGTFTGTVDGAPTSATLVYTGVTRPGGSVGGLMALSGDTHGLLGGTATAGVGGTYSGALAA